MEPLEEQEASTPINWREAAIRQQHYFSVTRFDEHVEEITRRLGKSYKEVIGAITTADNELLGYGPRWKWAMSTVILLRSLHIGDE